MNRALKAAILAASAVFFLYWGLLGLREQGVYLDVALFGVAALGVVAGLPLDPTMSLHLLGRYWPLMINNYNGACDAYLAIPFIWALKPGALALNCASLFAGLLSLPAIYWTGGLLLGDELGAAAACLLLATSPAYIAASRLGLYVGVFTCFLALGSLGCFLKSYETRKSSWGYCGFLLLGLGIWWRIQFVWFVAGLSSGVLVLKRDALRGWSTKRWLASAGSFGLGLSPVVVANLNGRFFTARFLLQYSLTARGGDSNLAYARHLAERGTQLMQILGGTALSAAEGWNVFALLLFAASLLWFLAFGARKRLSLVWFVAAAIFLQSPISPTMLDEHHLLLMLPLMCLAAAGATAAALRSSRLAPKAGVGVLVGLALAGQWRLLAVKNSVLRLHGGYEVRWNLAGELARRLQDSGIAAVGLGDTGLHDPLTYLSGGKLDLQEVFWAPYLGVLREQREEQLRRRLREEKTGYYVFRGRDLAMVHYYERFAEIVQATGKRLEKVNEVLAPDGQQIYVVYRTIPRSSP